MVRIILVSTAGPVPAHSALFYHRVAACLKTTAHGGVGRRGPGRQSVRFFLFLCQQCRQAFDVPCWACLSFQLLLCVIRFGQKKLKNNEWFFISIVFFDFYSCFPLRPALMAVWCEKKTGHPVRTPAKYVSSWPVVPLY